MADEQFPWLDWPHNYAPNLSHNTPRVDESNSHWRSPFHSTSTSNLQTSVNNNNSSNSTNTQSQYYHSYQQQDESYVRLEDVLPYPSYRWGPPPNREYQRQYPETSSGLPLPTPSISQQSPKRPASRQLPDPMGQTGSMDNTSYSSGHDAKRRRVESMASQSIPKIPKIASPVYSQVRGQPAVAEPRTHAEYNFPSRSNASQTPPIPQTTQPAAQQTTQKAPRPGSQYSAPVQSRTTSQSTQRTASPAMQQASNQRATQYAPPAQPKPPARAPASASPQTTAQQIPRRSSQYTTPNVTAAAASQTAAPSVTQFQSQQNHQHIPQPNSQYASPQPAPQALLQTVAPSDTQIRPPQYYYPRPNRSPQTQPQALQENSKQSPSQFTNQGAKQQTKPATGAASKSVSQSVAKPATPPVPKNVPQRPPSAQQAPPAPGPSKNSQGPPTQAQPTAGPQGQFSNYTFKSNDPGDRTYLKRRMDLVSKLNDVDAAQKVTYDPKTIARDILIAAGRHPTEATLNHHLFRLRDVFSAVEMNSDLGTFKWDIVDPGQPSHALKAKAAHHAPVQTSQTAPPSVHVQPPPVNNVNNTARPQPTFHQVQLPPPPQQSNLPPPPKPQSQFQSTFHSQPQTLPSPASRSQPAPSTPNSMEKRRRGRPPGSTNKPKVPAPAAAPQAPASSFPVFACRWGNCQAELHNLELLKKHLFKNHVSYQITCGWKGCTFTGTLPAAELMKHVKQEHLDTLAFKLGDGPAVPTSVDRGLASRTVPLTIPESSQPGNEPSLIFPADYNSIRAFNRVRGNNTQQEKAREIFKAVQRLKEHIGVGLDPGGCELATPLRNERVSVEEDVYEVQSGS